MRKEQCNRFKAIAKESSDGDEEIKRDIYNQFVNGLENSYFEESIFNNSMFLMVFAYYEGIINTIAVNENIKVGYLKAEDIIAKIERKKNFALSRDSNDNLNCIIDLRSIRNYITHNNGTLGSKKEEKIKSLVDEIYGVDITDGTIAICDLAFVLDTLRKIKLILDNLSTKLDYKTKIYIAD